MTTHSKSLPSEHNERLRGVVRELVDGEFQGNASRAAKAFGVTQSLVSEFLAGARGANSRKLLPSDWPSSLRTFERREDK